MTNTVSSYIGLDIEIRCLVEETFELQIQILQVLASNQLSKSWFS